MPLPLEDNFEDILRKAQAGLHLSEESLAQKAGVVPEVLRACLEGRADEAALSRLAPILGLHGPSLIEVARKTWRPADVSLEGLAQITTPLRNGITVNAYLVWDRTSRRAILFDTGTKPEPILELIRKHQLQVELLLLTHTHPDHVACLDLLRQALGGFRACVCVREPYPGVETIDAGAAFDIGPLRVQTRATHGHSPGGLTYVVSGLAHPVAVVGDALFAGSMGRSLEHWATALKNNREQIFTLLDDTILCPGHGPMTTVAQEKMHNPFYPEIK